MIRDEGMDILMLLISNDAARRTRTDPVGVINRSICGTKILLRQFLKLFEFWQIPEQTSINTIESANI
jgi:hypothetical protein